MLVGASDQSSVMTNDEPIAEVFDHLQQEAVEVRGGAYTGYTTEDNSTHWTLMRFLYNILFMEADAHVLEVEKWLPCLSF